MGSTKMNSPSDTPTLFWRPSEDFQTTSTSRPSEDAPERKCSRSSELAVHSENPATASSSNNVSTECLAEPELVHESPINGSFEPTRFPSIDSRTPTKRFLTSKIEQSPMASSCGGRLPENYQRDEEDDKDAMDSDSTSEEEEKEDEDNDEKNDSSSPDPSNSPSASSSATITDSATKRWKKREKKKARLMSKENLIKKQRIQRAEAQRVQEEKVSASKKLLAMYAAAVAKPTVSKTMRKAVSGSETHSSTASVDLRDSSPSYASTSSAVPHASSSGSVPVIMGPETSEKTLSGTSSANPHNTTCEVSTGNEEISSAEHGDPVEPVESEEFEVLICGQRRRVKPFTPRRQMNSTSADEQDSSAAEGSLSGNSMYDLPEHNPITVPFRQAQVPPNSNPNPNAQFPPNHASVPMVHSQPLPRYVMPISLPPPQPIIFRPPIVNSFGPQYVQFPTRFSQPPMPPVNMMPMQPPMPPPPMQHHQMPPVQMHQMHVPVMINGPMLIQRPAPMHAAVMMPAQPGMRMPPQPFQQSSPPQNFSQPPPPLPQSQLSARSMPLQRPSTLELRNPVRSQVYPGQRALMRPVRTPLAITAPPPDPNTLEVAAEPEENNNDVECNTVTASTDQLEMNAEQPRVRPEQTTSPDVNGDLILAGVAVVLDGPDDERPPAPIVLPEVPQEVDGEQEALNRVLGFSKSSGGEEFAIWTGFMDETPQRPLFMNQLCDKMPDLPIAESDKNSEHHTTVTHSYLPEICERILQCFIECGGHWFGASMNGENLRHFFEEAYGGSIPSADWSVLQKVCSFQPGYFHVFDALIGNKVGFSYSYQSDLITDFEEDHLRTLWRTSTVVDKEEEFFQRFRRVILPSVIFFLSERLITIRAFVSIVEVIGDGELTVSDMFYLASLVWGERQLIHKFNSEFAQIQIMDTGGKRWMRKTPKTVGSTTEVSLPVSSRLPLENRASNVPEFLARLRTHIDDVLQLLPDTVVDDEEFFRAVKLVCGWRGDQEKRVWESIVRDQHKYQEFHDAFRAFLRIEIRKDTMYLRKLAYTDQIIEEVPHLELILPTHETTPPSSFKSRDVMGTKKVVTFAGESMRSLDFGTQRDSFDMDRVWDLERELIRQLKRDNVTFAKSIKTENAGELYQLLFDILKNVDPSYFAHILEKAVTEIREQVRVEIARLRADAEEVRHELRMARADHEKELEEFQNRMEIISRFETYEVQVELRTRIDALKETIKEMSDQRDAMVREEVEDEKKAMKREKMQLIADHERVKRHLENEISRLKEENRNVLTEEDVKKELASVEEERVLMSARCELELNKARKVCEETSSLLRDSQREIEELRRENQRIRGELAIGSRQHNFITREPEHSSEISEDPPADPSPFQLSPRAKIRLSGMEKMQAEIEVHKFRQIARKMYEVYSSIEHVNRKERKYVEKQLMEFEQKMDEIENAIEENIELLKLNVVEDLVTIPPIPLPYSENIMRKMNEAAERYGLSLQDSDHAKEENVDGETDCCLICYDVVLATSDAVTCETCNKKYHQPCISQWLVINSVCPACFRGLKDPIEFPTLG